MNFFIVNCLIIFNLALFLPNNINPNAVSIESKNINVYKDWVKIDANYPQIDGMADTAFQDKLNKDIKNKIDVFAFNIEKQAKDNYDALKKTGNFHYEGMVSYKYNINGAILSIIMEYYSYLGGVHGAALRESINTDTKKGSEMQLKDLFKDKANYRQYILKNINDEIAKNPENYFSPKLDTFNESNFYLDENGNLVIYFNQYEIAPYVAGIVEFKMPLN